MGFLLLFVLFVLLDLLHQLVEGLEVADVCVDQRAEEDDERCKVAHHVPLDNAQGLESISSFAWLARVRVMQRRLLQCILGTAHQTLRYGHNLRKSKVGSSTRKTDGART